jgi:hypothetical protein
VSRPRFEPRPYRTQVKSHSSLIELLDGRERARRRKESNSRICYALLRNELAQKDQHLVQAPLLFLSSKGSRIEQDSQSRPLSALLELVPVEQDVHRVDFRATSLASTARGGSS